MEYLLTYGWALILIATIVGILVLIVATPGGYACSGTGDLICRALGAEGEDLVLSFQNKLPFDIIINPYTGIRFDGRSGYASIKYRGKTYRFEDATIGKGDQFQVTGIGLGNAKNISITYTETSSGFEKEWTGNTTTPQKEVCNNGIDDDGDALVDCADDDCATECTYVETGVMTTGDFKLDPSDEEIYIFTSTLPTEKRGDFQLTEKAVFSFYIESTGTWDLSVKFVGKEEPIVNATGGRWYQVEIEPMAMLVLNDSASTTFTLKNISGPQLKIRAPVATIRVEKREMP